MNLVENSVWNIDINREAILSLLVDRGKKRVSCKFEKILGRARVQNPQQEKSPSKGELYL